MENVLDHENWNDRWMQQILEWQLELEQLVDQAQMLLALIELAKSQLQSDPPE